MKVFDPTNLGRFDTKNKLKECVMQNDFSSFMIICRRKKNIIDKDFLKPFLIKNCMTPERKCFLRLYRRIFECSNKIAP